MRSPDGRGCRVQEAEQIVNVDLGRMADADKFMHQADQQARGTGPVKTRDSCAKVQGGALIQHIFVAETEQTTILLTDKDAAVCFSHIQDKCNETFQRVGKRHARKHVRECGVAGPIRQGRMASHTRHG